jgi:NADH:ubiquinone oxidoreductase subunit 3 (subunit A)
MSAGFDSLIRDINLLQDTEIINAVNDMKNSSDINAYLTNASTKIEDVVGSKLNNTITKTFSDMNNALDTNRNQFFYHQRNHDLNAVQQGLYNNIESSASKSKYNSDLAKRQYEMNEWASNNKMDTLFVFQILFIILLVETIFVLLWRKGFMNMGLLAALSSIMVIIFVFTVVTRAQYTIQVRNNRFWNKRVFDVYKPKPLPDCAAISQSITDAKADAENYIINAANAATTTASKYFAVNK